MAKLENPDEYIVVDATNMIMGRLASIVAKRLLMGQKIAIVNAEKVVISGKKKAILEKFLHRLQIRTHYNPRKGPFHYRKPDRILRRVIRGMLPYKKPHGREAFKRLRVFIGVPEELKDKPKIQFKEAHVSRLKGRYVELGEVAKEIGWRPWPE